MARIFYHLTTRQHSTDLSGAGSKQVDGRWHFKGVACHYLCSSKSRCLVEYSRNVNLVNLGVKNLVFVVLKVPDGYCREFKEADLPEDWASWPFPASSRAFGTGMLKFENLFLMGFPSAVFPDSKFSDGERVYVMNANHPMIAFVEILGIEELP